MNKQNEHDQDIIVPYDGGDIWIKRIASPTISNNGQLSIAVHSCSGIKTNVQRSIYDHSHTGFNYGYGGSGPADLALNILRMFTDEKTADCLHQDFKWKFVAPVDQNADLIIPREKILEFIAQSKVES